MMARGRARPSSASDAAFLLLICAMNASGGAIRETRNLDSRYDLGWGQDIGFDGAAGHGPREATGRAWAGGRRAVLRAPHVANRPSGPRILAEIERSAFYPPRPAHHAPPNPRPRSHPEAGVQTRLASRSLPSDEDDDDAGKTVTEEDGVGDEMKGDEKGHGKGNEKDNGKGDGTSDNNENGLGVTGKAASSEGDEDQKLNKDDVNLGESGVTSMDSDDSFSSDSEGISNSTLRKASEHANVTNRTHHRYTSSSSNKNGAKTANADRILENLDELTELGELTSLAAEQGDADNEQLNRNGTEDTETFADFQGVGNDGKALLTDDEMRSFWVITSVFATTPKPALLSNYFAFRDSLKRQGAHLCVVQLAYDGDPYIVGPKDADIVKMFRASKSKHLMWQKERLLNLALPLLPPEARYVAWVDADVLFVDDSWIHSTIEKLKSGSGRLVQLFSAVHYLDEVQSETARAEVQRAYHDGETLDLTSYQSGQSVSSSYVADVRGRPDATDREDLRMGLAWAAPRDLIATVRFPEFCVVGGGDKIMIYAALQSHFPHMRGAYFRSSPGQRRETLAYQRRLRDAIGGEDRVDYVDQNVLHLFHGQRKDRYYVAREKVLMDIHFHSKRHLRKEEQEFELIRNKLVDDRHHGGGGMERGTQRGVWAWKGSDKFVKSVVDKFRSYFEIKEHGKDAFGGTDLFIPRGGKKVNKSQPVSNGADAKADAAKDK